MKSKEPLPHARVLVTGATGFAGRAVCARLGAASIEVRRALRTGASAAPAMPGDIVAGDIGPFTNWDRALAGIDAVVHLAARVHVMRDTAMDPAAAFRRTNVEGTHILAQAAARAGVKRFVFVSTVKVNGENTSGRPFTEHDLPQPVDPYARSKWEAEQRLAELARDTGMAVTILRPPLMYGPGVKGNFLSLMRVVARGLPLPLGSVRNLRSLLFVGNLADAIAASLDDARSGVHTYLLSDRDDLSTPELIRRLSSAFDRPARLIPVPPAWLETACRALGRRDAFHRLAGSLQVDSRAITSDLGWHPAHSLDSGVMETVQWFRSRDG